VPATLVQADQNVSDRDFALISDLVYKHCGINLHEGKKELVQARIAKKLRMGGYRSVKEYLDRVLADESGQQFADLVDSLSTNLTSFFRESNHFDYLSRTHLPELLARKRKLHDTRIRAWSAGCSSGEEPYTLAITLLEAVGSGGPWDIRILATDISHPVLRTAQAGVYDKSRLESVPPGLRGKYFVQGPQRGTFQAAPALRDLIRFNYLNLQDNWPFTGPFDIIFCRNVMIYFDKPTQERLVNRFFGCLDGGGLLFTGHSESLTGVNHRFRYIQPTIYGKP
jgi:chemotaxis protein methyltransferase CheR